MGVEPLPVHFAQINQRDGFFLVGREPEPAFAWKNLEGRTLLGRPGSAASGDVEVRGEAQRRGLDEDQGAA